MKKEFLFGIFLFIFSNIVAQNKISLSLKDGSVINGIGKIKTDKQILFKKTKDAEKEFYNYETVKKVTIYTDNAEQTYEYKYVEGFEGFGSIKLLEIIIVGKSNLYQDYSSGMTYGPNMTGGYGFSSHSKTTYYISKNGEDIAINLKIGNTYSKRFKKIAQKIFSDCPELLNMINTKHFNRYGIKSVVNHYNEECK